QAATADVRRIAALTTARKRERENKKDQRSDERSRADHPRFQTALMQSGQLENASAQIDSCAYPRNQAASARRQSITKSRAASCAASAACRGRGSCRSRRSSAER